MTRICCLSALFIQPMKEKVRPCRWGNLVPVSRIGNNIWTAGERTTGRNSAKQSSEDNQLLGEQGQTGFVHGQDLFQDYWPDQITFWGLNLLPESRMLPWYRRREGGSAGLTLCDRCGKDSWSQRSLEEFCGLMGRLLLDDTCGVAFQFLTVGEARVFHTSPRSFPSLRVNSHDSIADCYKIIGISSQQRSNASHLFALLRSSPYWPVPSLLACSLPTRLFPPYLPAPISTLVRLSSTPHDGLQLMEEAGLNLFLPER